MLAGLALAACNNETVEDPKDEATPPAEETTQLKVASLIPPMTEILDVAKPLLAEQGVELEVVILSDNVQPNAALHADEVDANFFQHKPFMEEYNKNNDADLVALDDIYYPNFGIYSKNYDSWDALPDGATLAIANDFSNIDRTLKLLEMNPLESKHSLVIYEFLKRYENAEKIPKITIDELRQITDTQSKYPNFTDFERFVLKVAEKEINDKTNYQMTYDTFKTRTGRRPKVSEIQFYFAKKERLESEQAIEHEFNDKLFLDFRQIFKNLPIEDYSHACETFERSTLVRFLNDLKRKNYGNLKTECFLRYLIERTEKRWNGYFFKTQKQTPKEEKEKTSGSFDFDEYFKKERQKFFDV